MTVKDTGLFVGDGKQSPPSFPEGAPPSFLASELVLSGVAPHVAAGCAVRTSEGWASEVGGEVDVLFDLASLTKPLLAVAVALSGLSRQTRLSDVCPVFEDTKSAGASLELLLSHRAGLEAHLPVYLPLSLGDTVDPEAALRIAADGRRQECQGAYPAEGFPPLYSDLGYALAGCMLAAHVQARDAGEAIDRVVTSRLPDDTRAALGTARELSSRHVDVLAAAPTEDVPWRGGLVRGRVHDENAWALTGEGGSGHAGMFGTVRSLLAFGQALLDGLSREGPFGGVDLAWLVAERPGGTLRAGFDGKSLEGSSAGDRFSSRSFGHLGFTGTSLWVDPDARVVVVLLTNRVYPSRDRAGALIRAARPLAHDALHAYASSLA